jgi:hypothetical protein
MLIVTMPKIPGAEDLPGASTEKSEIITAVGTFVSVESLNQPDVAGIMDRI